MAGGAAGCPLDVRTSYDGGMEGVFVLRPATADDDASLARIDYESWSMTTSPSPRWARSRPFFGAETSTAPADVLVAQWRDVIVGYVKLRRSTVDHGKWRITGLAVDEAYRGRGVGRALVEAVIARAAAAGAHTVDLKVLGGNLSALALYRSLGFVETARVPGRFDLGGVLVDDVTMALGISPG